MSAMFSTTSDLQATTLPPTESKLTRLGGANSSDSESPETKASKLSGRQDRLKHLKLLGAEVGALDSSTLIDSGEGYVFSLSPVLLPKAALVEVSGVARFEFMAQFLATQQDQSQVWVEKDFEVFPTALWQRGLSLSNCVFVEAGDEVPWVLKQLLSAQVVPFIVGLELTLDQKLSRQLQLLAEKGGSTLFLTSKEPKLSWGPRLSLYAKHLGEGISVSLLRKRGAL